MEAVTVAGHEDPRLSDYRDLTDVELRRVTEPAAGLYIAESAKVIRRALAAGHRPRSVLVQEKWVHDIRPLLAEHPGTPVFVVTAEVAERLTGYAVHRGALAAMERPALPTVGEVLTGARRVLLLEDIVDHTNVGAAFRAAAGLGADAVLVTERCADPFYRRSVRVSMGTVFQVPWTRLPAWHEAGRMLEDTGMTLAALALAENAITLDALAEDPPERLVLALGAEGDGLSRQALSAADIVVTIPMAGGVDSLNVAAAASVALWALRV